MTGVREATLVTLLERLHAADLLGHGAGAYATAAIVAAHHRTPGVDVAEQLVADGWPRTSADRAARVAGDVLGPRPADPELVLRRALADAVYALEHPDQPPAANRVRQLRRLAGLQLVDADAPFARGMEGSARAAAKWTAEELAQVDAAIVSVAARARTSRPMRPEFTADDVWLELGDEFLVTKGLAGRLIAASNRGVCHNAGRTVLSERDGEHGHGQRLTVWAADEGALA